jgi:phage shock protein C
MKNQSKNGNMVGGLVLISLGIIFSFKTFFDINLFSYIKNIWPLGLVALGIYIILKEKGGFDDYNQPNNGSNSGTQF